MEGNLERSGQQRRPNTLQGALYLDIFPNIHVLLVIVCTLPITVLENKRSNSQLKLLKTYLRSTVSEERMSSFAIMKIHRSKVTDLNLDSIVADFANKHHRMLLPCLLSE